MNNQSIINVKRKTKSLKINAILNGVNTILSIIFPLLTYHYVISVIGVENIGKVEFSHSFVNYFILLSGLGIHSYAIREGVRVRENNERLSTFCSEVFSINVISSVLSLILLILISYFIYPLSDYLELNVILSSTIIANLFSITWLYGIEEDFLYITVRNLIFRTASLLLVFICVKSKNDTMVYALVTVIPSMGIGVVNFFHAGKYARIRLILSKRIIKHLKPVLIFFASTIAVTVYVNSDNTILGLMVGDYYVGLYAIPVKIYTILKTFISSLVIVAIPRVTALLSENKLDEYRVLSNKIFIYLMTVLAPVVLGVIMLAQEAVTIVGGNEYVNATLSMQILALSLFFSLISIFNSNVILITHNKERLCLLFSVTSALFNILLNIAIIEQLKHNGAAFTTLMSEFIVCMLGTVYSRKIVKIKIGFKNTLSILAGLIMIVFVCKIISLMVMGVIVKCIISVVASVLLYVSSLAVFKNDAINEMLRVVVPVTAQK